MSRNELLKKTNQILEKMEESSVLEVLHFAEYLLQKSGDPISSETLTNVRTCGGAFDFLENEPDLYTLNDCIEVYKKWLQAISSWFLSHLRIKVGAKFVPVIVYTELDDIIACSITSQLAIPNKFTIPLSPNSLNNLRTSSVVVVSKLGTFHQSIVQGKLGAVSKEEFQNIKMEIINMLNSNQWDLSWQSKNWFML